MTTKDLTIVVCCNKSDFFLARICIASIRYYYPDVAIELVKDPGRGNFDTTELEKYFKVMQIDLGVKQLGWSAAKFLYLYKFPKGKKLLMLDADIVFIGPFIEKLLPLFERNDYLVSIEREINPYADWVKAIYFDTKKIEQTYPDYTFPGYFFNAGQMFVTTGAIESNILNDYFDPHNYPYWKHQELFPLVDQSVYNYLLPTLSKQSKIKLGTADFMLWSKSSNVANLNLDQIINKQLTEDGLIHWAGDVRTPALRKMTRPDILLFFENYYYQQLAGGLLKRFFRSFASVTYFYSNMLYRKIMK